MTRQSTFLEQGKGVPGSLAEKAKGLQGEKAKGGKVPPLPLDFSNSFQRDDLSGTGNGESSSNLVTSVESSSNLVTSDESSSNLVTSIESSSNIVTSFVPSSNQLLAVCFQVI